MNTPAQPSGYPVLLFDGSCGLCQRLVRLLLRMDRSETLHFAPLQSPAGQKYLLSHGLPTEDFDTLVFVPDWSRPDLSNFLVRTDGVIAALRICGGLGRAIAAFVALFPRGLRDAVYRFVGHTRYRIFGPWRPRPLKRPHWAARFLPGS
jgi:predicted DCC family thiol-disulfide oxidoreductase YuxK